MVVGAVHAARGRRQVAAADVGAQGGEVGVERLLQAGAQRADLLGPHEGDLLGEFERVGEERRVELLVGVEHAGRLGFEQRLGARPRVAQDLPGVVDLGGALQHGEAVVGVLRAQVVGMALAREPQVAALEFARVEVQRPGHPEDGERIGGRDVGHAENEVPQPQEPVACGFLNTNPRSSSPSLKSSIVPPMKNSLFLSTTTLTPCWG